MAPKQWKQLSPRTRRLIVLAGTVDLSLRAAALIDLAQRRPGEIRGTKARWVAAILLVNSAGAIPVSYFRWGKTV